MQSAVPDYWSFWKQFVLQGVTQEDFLPPPIMQSWRRCAALGLDPYRELPAQSLSPRQGDRGTTDQEHTPQLISPTVSQQLLSLVRPAMEDLHQFAEGSECLVVFADAEARIVDTVGNQAMQEELDHLGFHIGAVWGEAQQGSNALALALQESFPMQLDGAMHYRAALHPFYTSAAPMHDLLGRAIGVLAVIGRHENCHPHTLGMITAAAQAITSQLQMQVWLSNANDLLVELKTILQALPEGILLLRRDGVISQMNAPAGTMLGLVPARVTGRRLSEVLPLPTVLGQSLTRQQELFDEELVFDTVHGRVTCLCSLKAISSSRPETGLEDIVGSSGVGAGNETVGTRVGKRGEGIPAPQAGSLESARASGQSEPVTADGFIMILRSIERVQKLVNRMTGARARLTFANVIGENLALKEAIRLARLAAQSNSTVLLHGETGTGKEIFAQSIHNSSARADSPFVAINCAAIPRELINTELFGYEGGSFTGADRQGRSGKFEQAHRGTLFLDEIGDMPLDLQTTLLRAIETHTIVRIGGHRVIPTDVRIIVATHKDLREEAQRGNFRLDLYYRLNVLTITIPSLRERPDDLPLLVQHFLQRQSRSLGRAFTITSEAVVALRYYSWPGNVRELENMLERVTYLMPKTTITVDDLPIDVQQAYAKPEAARPQASHQGLLHREQHSSQTTLVPISEVSGALKEHNRNAEMEAIVQAWHASNGHAAHAAALLGISRTTLWRKMVKYGLSEDMRMK